MAVDGGEPVTNNEKLYGDTLQNTERMCFVVKNQQIAWSHGVHQIAVNDPEATNKSVFHLSKQDELLMCALFDALETNWQNGDFNLDQYCTQLAMSRSGLYRKTVAITGFSPNALLKEFRLYKVQQELRKKTSNISQITFNAGFSSPSYFTKCFKKKFGVLPGKYLEMVE